MEFLLSILFTAIAVYAGAALLPGVTIKSFTTALWVALLLAIINATLGWILRILTFPFNWLTFGLVYFIINVLMILVVDKLVRNFNVKSFWWGVALALIISIISNILNWIF